MAPETKEAWRKETLRSAAVQGAVLIIAGGLSAIFGSSLAAGMPIFLRGYLIVWLIASVVALALVDLRLVFVLRLLVEAPWNARWWEWRLILSLVGAFCATAIATLSAAIAYSRWGRVAQTGTQAGASGAWLTPALFLLLIVLVSGVTLADFWRRSRVFHKLSDMQTFLVNLAASYEEHTQHPLLKTIEACYDEHTQQTCPTNIVRFDVKVSDVPDAIQLGPHPTSVGSSPGAASMIPLPSTIDQNSTERRIWEACNTVGWRLLLLGGRGGGKSTQLYLLASDLLALAQTALDVQLQMARKSLSPTPKPAAPDPTAPEPPEPEPATPEPPPLRFPVILDLSTWKPEAYPREKEPFKRWMAEEIARTYHIRKRTAAAWLHAGQFVPLLDALDGLSATQRTQINDYLGNYRNAPLVVCGRQAGDAEMGNARLTLGKTIALEPLEESAVLDALTKAHQVTGIGALVSQAHANTDLLNTLRTPMLLSVAMWLASREHVQAPSPTGTPSQDWERALLEQYMRRTLLEYDHGSARDAARADLAGLAWLGHELKQHGSLVLRFDEVQPDWLPTDESSRRYKSLKRTLSVWVKGIGGLLFALAAVLFVTVAFSLHNGAAEDIIFGRSPHSLLELISRVIIGLIGGIGIGIGMAGSLAATRNFVLLRRDLITPLNLGEMAMVATLVGLATALVATLGGGYALGVGAILGVGLVTGLAVDIALFLHRAVHNARKGFRRPNQPYTDSTTTAIRVAITYTVAGLLSGGLVFGLSTGLAVRQSGNVSAGVRYIVEATLSGAFIGLALIGLLFGVVATLTRGGAAAVNHRFVRQVLVQCAILPMDLLRFVRQMRDDKMLRQEGDGFTFIARSEMIRDHFAAEYERNATGGSGQQPPTDPAS